MLTLGHISYANCFPVHAGIVKGMVPFPFRLLEGIPTELNRFLAEGRVDVSPSSSIEFALHPGKYLILPDFSITSKNRAMSILLESAVPLAELDGRTVALTTASATSVVLLRIILELFQGVQPQFSVYEQGREDPYGNADAVLTIGDLALQRAHSPKLPHSFDLGEVWTAETGLPFVFALWQVNYQKKLEHDLAALYDILVASKQYGRSHLPELARSSASDFGMEPDDLVRYWNTFSYDLGENEQKGLRAYYKYAAELGVIDQAPDLRIWRKAS